MVSAAAHAQIDVLFSHDFENQANGDGPAALVPSGSGNPDWDNAIFNPTGGGILLQEVASTTLGANATKKFRLLGSNSDRPLLLGANFDPASDRYVIIEYDVHLNLLDSDESAGEIIYADGYDDLDGAGTSKIAIHLKFSEDKNISGNQPDDEMYYMTGASSDITSGTGAENPLFGGWTWSVGTWYRVQVIADQDNATFDINVTDVAAGTTQSASGLPYNDPTAGRIRKMWFAVTSNVTTGSFDNIHIYQNVTPPPATGPLIVFGEFSVGPVNTNAGAGMDVDFSDDSDLTAVEYKIGSGGTWTALTTDGTTAVALPTTPVNADVFITDGDFAGLPEGASQIFFRATDDAANTTESAATMTLTKDTTSPNVASITTPNGNQVPSLSAISGDAGDAVSGIPANSLTFALSRDDNGDYWDGVSAWITGPAINLATTHAATTDSTVVSWTDAVTLPAAPADIPFAQNMTVVAQVDDQLGNGAAAGAPVTFRIVASTPTITENVTSVGPTAVNTGIDIDFADETDLQFIKYKITAGGAWTDLTTDGTSTFALGGLTDTSVTAPVFITDADFAALPQGATDLFFQAEDNLGNQAETDNALVFQKDTVVPATASITAPSTDPFASLPNVTGQAADDAGGFGLAANSTTFSIRRGAGDYWDGVSAWITGPMINLPASHAATTDGSAVSWVKNTVIPKLADLTTGLTYTFGVTVTDRAGNTATGSFATTFQDVPELATVTDPVDASTSGVPFTVGGQAADHEGGTGLGINSTTFTYQRVSDSFYWDGVSAWGAGVTNLPTTHAATTGSQIVTWTASGTLPGAPDLSTGDYRFQATADNGTGTATGPAITATYSPPIPTISSAANQTFGVDDPDTPIATITITESGSPQITAASDIRIRIPAAFPMVWDTGITSFTEGGTATAKVDETAVTYEDAGKTAVLSVTGNFAAGETITVSGLKFSTFTTTAVADNLELEVDNGDTVIDEDDKTITIGAGASISSAANQTFGVGDPDTAIAQITITDSSNPQISAGNDIRIRIPAAFPMIWDTGITSFTEGGTAIAKVDETAVTYEDAGKTAVLSVTGNFAAGETITVSGLELSTFTTTAVADNLELETDNAGTVLAFDDKTITIGTGASISSAANQTFGVADPDTAISQITITESSNPQITAANDIRIRIPGALPMTWDTGITSFTEGGTASAKVDETAVTYEDAGKTAVLSVTGNFAAGETIMVSGLEFSTFTATAGADNLELETDNAGNVLATDDKTITIGAGATISSAANQTFLVGDPDTAISQITVTESSNPQITTGNDLRIRIPAGFTMQWDTTITSFTAGGTAAGSVNAGLVTYEDTDRTLVIDVTSNFTVGQTLTVAGLEFRNFSGPSAADNLELETDNAGTLHVTDDKTITVNTILTMSSAANQTFGTGDPDTPNALITVTDSTTPQITAAADIRIRIPAAFPMVWDTTITSFTEGGTATAKVDQNAVTYEAGGRTAVLDVTTDFAGSDTLTVSGLEFSTFTATAAADNLELEIDNLGNVAALDDKTITIGAGATISSAANQGFPLASPDTPIATITITEGAGSGIRAASDIRIRIPTGFDMIWDATLTSFTEGGTAAAKVDETSVTYEDVNQTAVISVTADFAPGETITIAALELSNFNSVEAADNLELELDNAGTLAALDDKTIEILAVVTITSRTTRDTDGDGKIDAIEIVTSGLLNDDFTGLSVAVDGYGTITGAANFSTGGTPNDNSFLVLIPEGADLDTGVTPDVQVLANTSLRAGGLFMQTDPAPVGSSDGAGPVIAYTVATPGTSEVVVVFSEPIDAGVVAGDFTFAGGSGQSITGVSGGGTSAITVQLDAPLSAADVVADTITPGAGIDDADPATNTIPVAAQVARPIADVPLGLASPVFATDGFVEQIAQTGVMTEFDGSGALTDRDITVQFNIDPAAAGLVPIRLHYDVHPGAGLWLPVPVPGLDGSGNADARSLTAFRVTGPLYDFLIPASDSEIVAGAEVELVLQLGSRYVARLTDPNDPRTLEPWSFQIRDIITQRGNVSVLNNVINPANGDQVSVLMSLSRPGLVTVVVVTLDGSVVDVLSRGMRAAGDHVVSWDGRNRGNRAVARGVYFITVSGPDIHETRRVLVVR